VSASEEANQTRCLSISDSHFFFAMAEQSGGDLGVHCYPDGILEIVERLLQK
jgi:hypothetical protein